MLGREFPDRVLAAESAEPTVQQEPRSFRLYLFDQRHDAVELGLPDDCSMRRVLEVELIKTT